MWHTAPVPMQPGTGLHARPMLSARAAKLPTVKAILAATSTHTPSRKPALGEVLELECSRLALEGKGVCLLPPTNFVVLCTRALPGEKLRAQITAVKKGFAEARKLTTLVPHRDAVSAPCPHFGPCGGCSLQSLAYEAQLHEKQNQVLQTLQRVGKLEGVDSVMKPILGCDASSSVETNSSSNNTNIMSMGSNSSSGETNSSSSSSSSSAGSRSSIYGYRNKMQFTFSSLCWEPDPPGDGAEDTHAQLDGASAASPSLTPYAGRVVHRHVLGFLRPGSQTEVLPISRCWLQDETSNALLDAVRDLALKHGLLPFNDPSGKGFLKHLVIRSSRSALTPRHQHQQRVQQAATNRPMAKMQHGKEYLVTLTVTQEDAVGALQPVADALVGQFPQVVGVVAKVAQPLSSPTKASATKTSSVFQAGRKGRRRGKEKALLSGKRSSSVQQQGQGAPPDEEEPSGWAGRVSNIKLLAGSRPYLTETLSGVQLRVSPDSFLQTNTAQAEVLYRAVSNAAQLRPTDVLLDLYCGAGSIGLSLAHQCAHVVGFEAEGAAVKDAWHNAATNGVTNASFACVDLNTGVPNLAHLLGPHMQTPAPASAPSTQAGHSSNAASVGIAPLESSSSFGMDTQGLSKPTAHIDLTAPPFHQQQPAQQLPGHATHAAQSSDDRQLVGDGGVGAQGLTAQSSGNSGNTDAQWHRDSTQWGQTDADDARAQPHSVSAQTSGNTDAQWHRDSTQWGQRDADDARAQSRSSSAQSIGGDAGGGRCGQLLGNGNVGAQGLTAVSRGGAEGGVSALRLTVMNEGGEGGAGAEGMTMMSKGGNAAAQGSSMMQERVGAGNDKAAEGLITKQSMEGASNGAAGEEGVHRPAGGDSCLSSEHTEGGVLSRRRQHTGPDVIVCDPARAGLSLGVVEYLLRSSARRVVYVSCNPATQARDLALLCKVDGGGSYMRTQKPRGRVRLDQAECIPFQLVAVRPVDMFPHTDHVETVVALDRQQR